MLKPELVAAMWHDYDTLKMSLSAVERKYGKKRGSLRYVFLRRGHVVREVCKRPAYDPVTGRILKAKEPTAAELAAIISKLKRVMVPPELKVVWRRWSMKKRGRYIRLVRKHLANPNDRPESKFSKNVTPFDYTTPAAWEIAKRENKGLISRTFKVKLKPASQGVIYKGKVWFWAPRGKDKAYYIGVWTKEHGRRSLHHQIWEENFGPLPESTTVIFKDGNKNNLDPSNLALRSRAQCARENSIQTRLKNDPHNPELIAKGRKRIAACIESRRRRSARLTSALLQQHNSGQSSMVALKK